MPRGKKIALELPEELVFSAKQRALDDRTNFRTVVINALERYLGKKGTGRHGKR